jgi:hypothetical protein
VERVSFRAVSALLLLCSGLRGADTFADKVGPILRDNCVGCHNEKNRSSGLSLASEADLLAGGARRGPLVQPGKPDDSTLLKILRGQVEPRMPLGKPALAEGEISAIVEWIKGLDAAAISSNASKPSDWWAFQPPKKIPPPAVKSGWARNAVDQFILAKLEQKNLSPAPEASKQVLLRRAFFDLIGLPPSPAEAAAFLNDTSADAYEKLVDRRLADRRHGARWGRHWLDLARYSDTRGFEGDPELSHAWRYRDYVIDSFNKDKPYDRFVKEQLSGDEVVVDDEEDGGPRNPRQASPEGQIAVTFLRLGPWFPGGGPSIQSRQILLDEITATVGSVFLGLTVKCAQCHNHKYDPILQKDYYRLQAFFAPIEFVDSRVAFTDPAVRARMETHATEYAAKLKVADAEFQAYQKTMLAKLEKVVAEAGDPKVKAGIPELTKRMVRDDAGNITASQDTTFTTEEKQKYLDLLTLMDPTAPGNRQPGLLRRQLSRYEPMAHTARNASLNPLSPNRPMTHVLIGGEFDKPGELVEPGFLSPISGNTDPALLPTVGFGNVSRWRSVLADWIVSPKNPLAARVMANRIWQHHFGTGIVATPSDFGKNGARPTNPELLDYLAVQFVEKGWSVKAMHRLIMTSATYRQSSVESNAAAEKADPENNLLWRMNRTRLEGDILRDSILAVSGRLNPEPGGPGVFPVLPDELANLKIKNRPVWEPDNGAESFKRSIYIMQRRQLQVPFLNAMDFPALNESCERRFVTTTAIQALSLMDGQLATTESKYFAQRVREKAGEDPAGQIRLAFDLALARQPSAQELSKSLEYLKTGGDLTSLCRILFNTNEFIYVR